MERWHVGGIKLRLHEVEQEQKQLRIKVAAALRLPAAQLLELNIRKKSLDAREAGEPFFVYSLEVLCAEAPRGRAAGRGIKITALGNSMECDASGKLPLAEFKYEKQQRSDVGSEKQQRSDVGSEKQQYSDVGSEKQLVPDVSSKEQQCSDVGSKKQQCSDVGSKEQQYSDVDSKKQLGPDVSQDRRFWQVALAAYAVPPVVVGAGPAGLFAALCLAEAGYKPLLLEQGQPVERRLRDVERFWQEGLLDESSNVQFGEGGAGTFSDGKLTFRGKDALAQSVLRTLVELGAPPHILYWHKPHLGSDKLRQILPLLRRRIQAAGGRILFGTRLNGLRLTQQNGVRAVAALQLSGAYNGELETQALVLAPGNGARVTFYMLDSCGAAMCAKPFAVGLRIEHSQSLIDKAQYGMYAGHASLPTADYQLKYKAVDGRSFYSFCMCPGGHIVNAASEARSLVTNGISLAARNSGRANSAVVGEVAPGRDFADDPLAALTWQQELEQAAYRLSGAEHSLPVCMVEDFIRGWGAGQPQPEFAPLSRSWQPCELRPLLPQAIGEGLVQALVHWNKQVVGFAEQAVLAAVESRTSCPVRILRGEDGQSINICGLYPAGEGAGYAGGILSSAVDGLRAAYALQQQHAVTRGDFPLSFISGIAEE